MSVPLPRRMMLVWLLLISLSARLHAGVVISEFLSSNQSVNGLRDEDGDLVDWIELLNTGPEPAYLKGWRLTDRPGEKAGWEFPETTLMPGVCLVVFASGKDRAETARPLHTDFALKKSGEALALIRPDGSVADLYPALTPEQTEDFSYGRLAPEDGAPRGFLSPPSPGVINNPTDSPPDPPVAEPPGGAFTDALTVMLSSPVPGAVIRYTLNGKLPDASSPAYGAPLILTESARLRARVFVPGRKPGMPCAHGYALLDPEVAATDSNLPLLIVDTFGSGRPEDEVGALWMVFMPQAGTGRTVFTGPPQLDTLATVKVRGSSTADSAKYSMALESKDASGRDRDVSPAGMPEDEDWVLHAPYDYDRSLIRNPLVYQLSNDAGRYAVRTQAVELYLNTDGGPVSAADYAGVYTLMERIGRGTHRVNVEKMGAEGNAAPAVQGGYVLKIDRADPGDTGFKGGGQQIYWVDPSESKATGSQLVWIKNYLDAWEKSLTAPDFFDPVTGYAKHADPESFIDHHLLNVAVKNVDGLRLSSYFSKSRYGRLTAGPVWDFDRSLDSVDARDDNYNTWRGETGDLGTDFFRHPWYQEMFRDRNFAQRWIDRLEELRQGALSDGHITETIARQAAELTEAAPRNFARWPERSPRAGGWSAEIDHLRGWFLNRLRWMDAQVTRPPTADRASGPVEPGTLVTLTSPSLSRPDARIYYTTDGTDPRLFDTTQGQSVITDTFVSGNHPLRILLPVVNPGTAWRDGSAFDDSAWLGGTGGVGYDDSTDYLPFIGLNLVPPPDNQRMKGVTALCLMRFRFETTRQRIAALGLLKLRMRYDDGFTAWLNGTRIASANTPSEGSAWNAGATANHPDSDAVVWRDFDVPDFASLLREGENVLAIQGLNYGVNSTDFLMQAELVGGHIPADAPEMAPQAQVYSGPLTIDKNTVLTARTYDPAGPFAPWPYTGPGSGQTPILSHWSAPLRLTLTVDAVPAAAGMLTVSEIMYHPAAPTAGQRAQGFLKSGDFEFIELTNVSDRTLDLSGLTLGGGVSFTFAATSPQTLVAPGGTVVLTANEAAFTSRYGSAIPVSGSFNGHLGNSGDTLTLTAANGGAIQSFSFADSAPWPAAADGGGASLELKNPAAQPLPGKAIFWQASSDPGGTPGGQTAGTYAVWRQRHFPDGGAESDPQADPDQDGVPNLLEFACGTSPLLPNPPPGGLCTLAVLNGRECLAMPISRRQEAVGTWTMECSTDLIHWTPVEGTFQILSRGGGLEHLMAYCLSSPGDRRWLRFRFETP